MTKIENRFKELKQKGQKAFIAYLTAGDPTWQNTADIILEMEDAGVDIIELGIPFSDPLADGPTIQRASQRALESNISLKNILEGLTSLRKKTDIPVLVFSYYNPVFKLGIDNFAQMSKEAKADGALITDLTPESAEEYKKIMDTAELNTVFLTAPTTREKRLKEILKFCSGFVYYVSRTGVTGVQENLDMSISNQVDKIKSLTDLPVAVGFGVSKPEHVENVASYADGVVVGSAIVNKIEQTNGNAKEVGKYVKELVRGLK